MDDPQEVIWRRVDDDLSFEHARLKRLKDGIELSGLVLVSEMGAPLRLDYRIACDGNWRTLSVELSQDYLGQNRTLRLDRDGAGHWRINGHDAPALTGCSDLDLGFSPSTNALPINRLRLPIGESCKIRAAWVHFPSLEVRPAEQSYERLDEMRYRYRSLASGFVATLEVNPNGLPTSYSDIWRQIAQWPPAQANAAGDPAASA